MESREGGSFWGCEIYKMWDLNDIIGEVYEIFHATEIDPNRGADELIVDREIIPESGVTEYIVSTYLEILEIIMIRIALMESLPEVDIEVVMPEPATECSICLDHYFSSD